MFSKNLKKIMSDLHITQAELAAKSGLTKASISQYLSGKNRPRGKALKALAEALEVPDKYLSDDYTEPLAVPEGLPMRLTPNQVGALMGVSGQMIRVNLQTGRLPFGYALKGTGDRFRYSINTRKFMEYTGCTERDVLGVL